MKTGRIAIANESFAGQASPELRAVGRLEGTGYETDLCPSKAEARRIILDDRRAFLEKIAATTELDWLCLWPYDQGGCNCHQCTPWPVKYMETLQGDRGVDLRPPYGDRTDSECLVDWCPSAGRGRSFLRVIGATGALVRNHCRRNRRNPALALSGAKGSRGLRSLAFSEISMFDALPWGSRGANPSPRKFATEMKDLEPSLTGAMPYSEGRYEDVNKVVWAQLLWNRRRDPGAILADYCRYSFGPEAADTGARLLFDLEEGLRDLPSAPKRYEDALALESRMEEWGRAGWRWQVVRARAAIDALKWEIQSTDTPEDRRSQAATELRVVYEHLQHELYLHDGDRSLRNWIWLPFDVWVKLPFNALVLPLESA